MDYIASGHRLLKYPGFVSIYYAWMSKIYIIHSSTILETWQLKGILIICFSSLFQMKRTNLWSHNSAYELHCVVILLDFPHELLVNWIMLEKKFFTIFNQVLMTEIWLLIIFNIVVIFGAKPVVWIISPVCMRLVPTWIYSGVISCHCFSPTVVFSIILVFHWPFRLEEKT